MSFIKIIKVRISIMINVLCTLVSSVIYKRFCFSFFIYCCCRKEFSIWGLLTIFKINRASITFIQTYHPVIFIITHGNCITICIIHWNQITSAIRIYYPFFGISDICYFFDKSILIFKGIFFSVRSNNIINFFVTISLNWNRIIISINNTNNHSRFIKIFTYSIRFIKFKTIRSLFTKENSFILWITPFFWIFTFLK